ncbi:transcription-repair coupling factor (superfamily II helicase) [Balneicella halophila]|uniref:Transcription-repair-coupling factor n=1 Tax=Balneicella halophila TaxID=1537566 RepID=A0A7L4UP18_BALHA|nr:transcription-repair coupling factor [Balneicella halophila]PVX50861.1 transcription-repair coupling factor (superfamily II helicase) [Balneicella halophila]
MEISKIKQKYAQHSEVVKLREVLELKETNSHFYLKGISQSALAVVFATAKNPKRVNVILKNTQEDAAYFFNDLKTLLPEYKLLYFPASFTNTSNFGHENNANDILRTEVLQNLEGYRSKLVIVSYPDALIEKVTTKKILNTHILKLNSGENYDISELADTLLNAHFEQVDFVDEPGQFALRGSILDIFSFSNDTPYRIDFFDDEIQSIRSFEIESQLSVSEEKSIKIIPNLVANTTIESLVPFYKFLPSTTLFWTENLEILEETLKNSLDKILQKHESTTIGGEDVPTSKLLWTEANLADIISKSEHHITWGIGRSPENYQNLTFNISPQPSFNKNFDLLIAKLKEYSDDGISTYILSENSKQLERLKAIFEDKQANVAFTAINQTLHEGFIDNDLKIACFTDHQLFERYHRHKLRNERYKKAKGGISVSELMSLKPGDYIVHNDHGVGQFVGLQKINEQGKNQEVIKLVYRDNDILLVNLHSLHKISKFREKDGQEPKINKLGTAAWQNLKNRTKSKIKDIAKDLIALYAKRKAKEGYAYQPDTFLQQELEASFIYEDTPDQEKATQAVKEDMESKTPMDRLVCGDVGFGKTEIAIRAAFKAVSDNKQVAILVPTTILAFQHHNTFSKRLKDFPCRVEYISRLRSAKKQREIIADLKEGQIDIIIGTHKLISKNIQFKDLGLLIIDEEQRFGVAVKEKLKNLKVNVDTLTLTATPIPRTLQFSLMGARDLSIINTPPPNRQPIQTELHGFNDTIIREAILFELNRGGQVFFIHNRVQNIYELQAYIEKIVPEASTVVGHGQMDGAQLEKTLLNFIEGQYDVLIATTIIESGLDIANANTIIINQAHQFGLSELHQLRGRVGRSNTKAFCYLLAPPLQSLTWEARRRLKALEDFSDLGSGFNLAMQDLDIRGAGNLLGGEQSGFISDIGYETYQRILDEALLELRTTEFKELFENEEMNQEEYVNDCQIDTDFEALIPESYVENTSEKIRLYRELDNTTSEKELQAFSAKLKDRFGEIPEETQALMNIVRIREMAKDLGMERIIMKQKVLIAHLVSDRDSAFYQSALFSKILQAIQIQIVPIAITEKNDKLRLKIEKVNNVNKALEIIEKLWLFSRG